MSRLFTSYLDFLWIVLMTFVVLFFLVLLHMNPVAKKAEVERKAEFLIVVEWDAKSRDDVDSWLRTPSGRLLSFRNREVEIYHLDRDDTGAISDTIKLPDGSSKTVYINKEVTTFRGWQKGEYVFNLHMYSKRDSALTDVNVQMMKLNPFKVVYDKTIPLSEAGQERTFLAFTIDEGGDVVDLDESEIMIAQNQPPNTNGNNGQ